MMKYNALFQFLMVRLKESQHPCRFTAQEQFQFLMVRLKDQQQSGTGCYCQISIPYGAIKSPQ